VAVAPGVADERPPEEVVSAFELGDGPGAGGRNRSVSTPFETTCTGGSTVPIAAAAVSEGTTTASAPSKYHRSYPSAIRLIGAASASLT